MATRFAGPRAICALVSVVFLSIVQSAAAAVSASSDTSQLSQQTNHPFMMGGFPITEDVAFSPIAGPWVNHLINGGGSHNSGQDVPITETLTNTGTAAWVGWHEEVRSRTDIPGGPGDEVGFLFRQGSLSVQGDYGSGFVPLVQGADYTLVPTLYSGVPEPGNNSHFEAITIFFAPGRIIESGDRLRINKQIFEVFGDADPWRPEEEALIAQFPIVPEPSGLVIGVIALIAASARSSRRGRRDQPTGDTSRPTDEARPRQPDSFPPQLGARWASHR